MIKKLIAAFLCLTIFHFNIAASSGKQAKATSKAPSKRAPKHTPPGAEWPVETYLGSTTDYKENQWVDDALNGRFQQAQIWLASEIEASNEDTRSGMFCKESRTVRAT
jgi:hypothetical protein